MSCSTQLCKSSATNTSNASQSCDQVDLRYGDESNSSEDEKLQQDENEEEGGSSGQREANIEALKSGTLKTQMQPFRPSWLVLLDDKVMKPFKSPVPGHPNMSEHLKRKLALRKNWFVPYGSSKPFVPGGAEEECQQDEENMKQEDKPKCDEDQGIVPLILWQRENDKIVVDEMLVKFLRPHQREGVQFMFECVTGQRDYLGQGCILADDMGLGKTLQGITLMWTLLKQGHAHLGGKPIAKRVIIVCPTSLIGNWDNECNKWLEGRVKTLPLGESTRDEVEHGIRQFLSARGMQQVMIISYETFRMHSDKFHDRNDACDLLICDEAHRLKNDQTKTTKALDGLSCVRRVLLSGTPMQNHLDEFYSMVNFCNPNVLGTPGQFRRHYELPILAGREPDAPEQQVKLAQERTQELQQTVDQFILRRTNTILSSHLPPKVIEVVCCKMTPLQTQLYQHFLSSKAARSLIQDSEKHANTTQVLSAITQLRKLCNHPKLIYDTIKNLRTASVAVKKKSGVSTAEDGFQGCEELIMTAGSQQPGWEDLSGKMALLARMLGVLRHLSKDRIVIVSNFTQTLELISCLCKERNYPYVQLDGATSIAKRTKLVKQFCDPQNDNFIFLLSSKAGGCGLNLIGANRLILFDPDWNPATDKQAAARVWRDGQKKKVYVYRFLTTGSIEEKVYQRQLSKEGLQNVVNQSGKMTSSKMSIDDLRDLFSIQHTVSDTYDTICCGKKSKNEVWQLSNDLTKKRPGFSVPKPRICKAQVGNPSEDDLHEWGHHTDLQTVPDELIQRVGQHDVSFVFSCQVSGKPVEQAESRFDENEVQGILLQPTSRKGLLSNRLNGDMKMGGRRLLISAPLLKSVRTSMKLPDGQNVVQDAKITPSISLQSSQDQQQQVLKPQVPTIIATTNLTIANDQDDNLKQLQAQEQKKIYNSTFEPLPPPNHDAVINSIANPNPVNSFLLKSATTSPSNPYVSPNSQLATADSPKSFCSTKAKQQSKNLSEKIKRKYNKLLPVVEYVVKLASGNPISGPQGMDISQRHQHQQTGHLACLNDNEKQVSTSMSLKLTDAGSSRPMTLEGRDTLDIHMSENSRVLQQINCKSNNINKKESSRVVEVKNTTEKCNTTETVDLTDTENIEGIENIPNQKQIMQGCQNNGRVSRNVPINIIEKERVSTVMHRNRCQLPLQQDKNKKDWFEQMNVSELIAPSQHRLQSTACILQQDRTITHDSKMSRFKVRRGGSSVKRQKLTQSPTQRKR